MRTSTVCISTSLPMNTHDVYEIQELFNSDCGCAVVICFPGWRELAPCCAAGQLAAGEMALSAAEILSEALIGRPTIHLGGNWNKRCLMPVRTYSWQELLTLVRRRSTIRFMRCGSAAPVKCETLPTFSRAALNSMVAGVVVKCIGRYVESSHSGLMYAHVSDVQCVVYPQHATASLSVVHVKRSTEHINIAAKMLSLFSLTALVLVF
ncbi:hypothetical protein F2P81_006023 [Scophthalmus maximus]|uniref:Uncharacterized protein n=1 Tax=Scophthalmus maximus TaxID=52904 RepID=A0A6A4TI25_SCOMX|nr:hypothetical protein F2P81_006023 [Scophthalmus maximus]